MLAERETEAAYEADAEAWLMEADTEEDHWEALALRELDWAAEAESELDEKAAAEAESELEVEEAEKAEQE